MTSRLYFEFSLLIFHFHLELLLLNLDLRELGRRIDLSSSLFLLEHFLFFLLWILGGELKNFCFNLTLRSLVYFLCIIEFPFLFTLLLHLLFNSAIYFSLFLLQLFLLDQGRIWDLDLLSSLFHSWDLQLLLHCCKLSTAFLSLQFSKHFYSSVWDPFQFSSSFALLFDAI